jgi:hypothetical protein
MQHAACDTQRSVQHTLHKAEQLVDDSALVFLDDHLDNSLLVASVE